ncbi:MAG: glycine--tRNA ligase subunit beta, partial [Desulfovibrio sp.]|nr:glycine--tRNA ligase subunit beta [Desulfovibrio sp.]
QGIMGGIYAEKMGEDPKVASALKEQYLPQGPDSPLPKTLAGAILAICDKADTLAGCFGLNKIPTGTADPFALRRCALGIIRICEAFALPLHLPALLDKARALYGEKSFKLDPKESLAKLLEFFRARLSNYLQGLGYNAVLTEACLKAGALEIPDLLARIKALDFLAKEEDFVAKAQILKRIANILQKKDESCLLRPELLTTEVEQALLAADKKLEPLNSSQNYSEILATLAWLKPVVDDFFNGVMVLCEDQNLQGSRLALLAKIQAFYARVADFSALQL